MATSKDGPAQTTTLASLAEDVAHQLTYSILDSAMRHHKSSPDLSRSHSAAADGETLLLQLRDEDPAATRRDQALDAVPGSPPSSSRHHELLLDTASRTLVRIAGLVTRRLLAIQMRRRRRRRRHQTRRAVDSPNDDAAQASAPAPARTPIIINDDDDDDDDDEALPHHGPRPLGYSAGSRRQDIIRRHTSGDSVVVSTGGGDGEVLMACRQGWAAIDWGDDPRGQERLVRVLQPVADQLREDVRGLKHTAAARRSREPQAQAQGSRERQREEEVRAVLWEQIDWLEGVIADVEADIWEARNGLRGGTVAGEWEWEKGPGDGVGGAVRRRGGRAVYGWELDLDA